MLGEEILYLSVVGSRALQTDKVHAAAQIYISLDLQKLIMGLWCRLCHINPVPLSGRNQTEMTKLTPLGNSLSNLITMINGHSGQRRI